MFFSLHCVGLMQARISVQMPCCDLFIRKFSCYSDTFNAWQAIDDHNKWYAQIFEDTPNISKNRSRFCTSTRSIYLGCEAAVLDTLLLMPLQFTTHYCVRKCIPFSSSHVNLQLIAERKAAIYLCCIEKCTDIYYRFIKL